MLSKASNMAKRGQLSAYSRLNTISARFFAAPTQELLENLKANGIRNKNVVHNPR
jgi:hypothetical protein